MTELVARASDRWDRAALDLALALVGRFASNAGRVGLPVVRCIGQRGKAESVARYIRRAFSWALTAYPGEIRTPSFRLMFDVTRF